MGASGVFPPTPGYIEEIADICATFQRVVVTVLINTLGPEGVAPFIYFRF